MVLVVLLRTALETHSLEKITNNTFLTAGAVTLQTASGTTETSSIVTIKIVRTLADALILLEQQIASTRRTFRKCTTVST